ncbi:MAG: acyltransferase family protein [Eubacterium sp.]|nr:acyltransferase family protein [Eubacterium sp.]
MAEKARIEWIDILKLLGMIAIFCGHFGTAGGRLYEFVFCYHVQLFFFASGIFAGKTEGLGFWEAVKKRFHQIMLPYAFLVMINMVMLVITENAGLVTYARYMKQFIWGIRNQIPIGALWFFPCIFCTGVMFDVLRRVCRKDAVAFLASAALYAASVTLFPNNPGVQPSWIWNVDSACHYMVYYALGYVLRKKLTGREENADAESAGTNDGTNGGIRRYLFFIGAVLVTGYAASVYIQRDIAGKLLCRLLPFAGAIYPVIRALLLIGFNMVLAKILEGFQFLSYAGTQTLWLCGNESIVKTLLGTLAGLIGLRIEVTDEASALLYAAVMMLVIIVVLLPAEQRLYRKCREYFAKFGSGRT